MNEARFCRLWTRCGGDDAGAAAVFAELAARYAEPHRRYHNGRHIDDCLARLDAAADAVAIDDADAVEMALWFHDVVYELGAADNEALSAKWFAAQAEGVLPAAFIGRVADYINRTTHRAPPEAPGAKWVVDADLGGLGQDDESFRRDGANIRREFAHLSDDDFARGQAAFLRTLVAREFIFCTDFFRTEFEARARRHIAGILARHSDSGEAAESG